MTKVISISNQKGGVGKTTTAVNLAAGLADLDYRVLVVDMDAQGNTSSGLGIQREQITHDMYDCLLKQVPVSDIILEGSHPNVFVAPSTVQLAGAEVELSQLTHREQQLTKTLASVLHQYDYVLIDCPPSLGHLTINAFCASQSVLIPVQCEYYALEGLSQLLNTIRLVQRHFHPKLHIEGVLLTMYDGRTNLSNEVVEEVRRYFKEKVYQTVIPRNVRLSEAPSHGKAVLDYDRRSRGSESYRALAKEVSQHE